MAGDFEDEDYKFCHQLLLTNISMIEKMEVYATGAIAATMVFALAATDDGVFFGASLVSMLIAGIGAVRFVGLDSVIRTLNDYLQAHGPSSGWTAYYRINRAPYLSRSRKLIWIILNLVTIIFAVLAAFHGPFKKEGKVSGGGDSIVMTEGRANSELSHLSRVVDLERSNTCHCDTQGILSGDLQNPQRCQSLDKLQALEKVKVKPRPSLRAKRLPTGRPDQLRCTPSIQKQRGPLYLEP